MRKTSQMLKKGTILLDWTTRILGVISGFIQWWVGELAGLIPQPLLPQPVYAEEYICITTYRNTHIVRHHNAEDVQEIASCPSDLAALRQSLNDLRSADRQLKYLPIRFEVSLPNCMKWRKVRPAVAIGRLRDIAKVEATLATPIIDDHIEILVDVIAKNEDGIQTDDYAIKRSFLNSISQMFNDLEVSNFQIGPEGTSLDFLSTQANPGILALVKLTKWAVLAGVATSILLSALWIRQDRIISSLQADASALQFRIENIRTSDAGNVTERYTAYQSLATRRSNYSSLSENWNVLSNILPDQAWVSELSLKGNTVKIAGFAREAAPLVNTLESHPRFSSVRLIAPISLDSRHEAERFSLEMISSIRSAENGVAQ